MKPVHWQQEIEGEWWRCKFQTNSDRPYYFSLERQVPQWEPPQGWDNLVAR